MITIMKASAGSGKTFNLARKYIELMLRSREPAAYRHILAVTFTNKATAEMKGRILQKLYELSTEPRRSGYFDDFVPGVCATEDELRRVSAYYLSAILHDYGAFSVSTIDRFFQQTLKAFSREIGQFSSYQVELDKKSLVKESADRFLDSVTENDKAVLKWLTEGAIEIMEQGKRFNLDKIVEDYATDVLCSDSYSEMVEKNGIDETEKYSMDNLGRIRKVCSAAAASYRSALKSAAGEISRLFGEAGIPLDSTYKKFMESAVRNYSDLKSSDEIKFPTATFMSKAGDSSSWFSKANEKEYLPLVTPEIEGAVSHLAGLFGRDYDVFRTAGIIGGQLYGLGVIADIRTKLSELMKEKNVMPLRDSDSILRRIIDGSDTPFIYEKTGVRYQNFLLDEFQDTSLIQWSNFLPLVRNSEAQGFDSLIVGDVKQSIYRWRGSDWHLLNTGLQSEFGISDENVVSLQDNYRTLREIVLFNNGFFEFAAGEIDRLGGTDQASPDSLSRIYADVRQNPKTADDAPGSVEAVFCEKDAEMDEILDSVRAVRESGGEYGMIAILVRKKEIGAEIADMLVSNGIPVVSDDSLKVKSSMCVRRLTVLLSCIDNPADSINAYLASELDIELPQNHYSVTELCEKLLFGLQSRDEALYRMDIPYIRAFLDKVLEWTSVNGNELGAFLKWWNEQDPVISSSESSGSVRIMTIHQSKGLEFPYVIVPFAEMTELSSGKDKKWCSLSADGTVLEPFGNDIFSVKMSGAAAEHSLFAEDYRKEMLLQHTDCLNIFYVALTRAQKGLKIIAALPEGKYRSGGSRDWKNMSHLMYAYLIDRGLSAGEDGQARFALGEAYDFSSMERAGSSAVPYPGDDGFFSSGNDGRLRLSSGEMSPERLRGIALHDILSRVKKVSELGEAVAYAVRSGLLPEDDRQGTEDWLRGRIEAVADRGWFPEDGARVLNEVTVFGADGREHRPDRVIVRDGAVSIVDYKFGEPESSHRKQVRRYADTYRAMGYGSVSAFLWYFNAEAGDGVEEV